MLWDRSPDAQARTSFRQALREISLAMGPLANDLISTDRDIVKFNADLCWIDATAVLATDRSSPSAGRCDLAAICTGELLEELDGTSVSFDQWLLGERSRFTERLREILEAELHHLTRTKADAKKRAVIARRLIAFDPTHEGASRALMRALAGTGERAQAVREYARCRKALRKALDVEPSPETRALCEAIRSFTGCEGDKAVGPSTVSRRRGSSIQVPRTDQGRPRVDPMLVMNVSRNSTTRRKGPRTMPVLSLATINATPSPSQLVAQAEAMIPVLRQRAGDADRNARLAPETIRELREAGFFRILQPPRFAGYGMRPSVLWEVTRHLGRGCGSTAFIVSLLGVHAWIVGMFEPRAQAEVFHGGADTMASNLSIGVRRGNSVTRTEDGYIVTGKWGYASGIDFADWVITAIEVPSESGGLEERIALIPAGDFSIDYDTWKVVGARGTGSKDVALHNVFVPHYRTLAWKDVERGEYPGAVVNDGPLYRLSAGSLFVLSSAAPVVAVACAAVDCFIEEIKRRSRQVKQQWVQIELGSCASQIHMAHSLLIRDADEVFDWAAAGQDLSVEIQARHRADAATIARTALSGAERLFRALGGSLLPAGNTAERAFRDIHAMATHWRVQPEPACELHGRVLLGLDVD
jgi:DNA-binding SARP family transcriptional activator/alkylation response protein AidB-like acyl-CoA dehydrogenase